MIDFDQITVNLENFKVQKNSSIFWSQFRNLRFVSNGHTSKLWWRIFLNWWDGPTIMSIFKVYSQNSQWLDSDLIPRLLEKFEKLKNFIVILFNLENNPYRRIFSA